MSTNKSKNPNFIATMTLAVALSMGVAACSDTNGSSGEPIRSSTTLPEETRLPIIDQIGIYTYTGGVDSMKNGDREYRTDDGSTQGYVYCEKSGELIVTLGTVNGKAVTSETNTIGIKATDMDYACFDDFLDSEEARKAVQQVIPDFIAASE